MKKITFISTVAAAFFSFIFVSCFEKTPAAPGPKLLPASTANRYVTSQSDFEELVESVMYEVSNLDEENGLYIIAEAIDGFDYNNIQPDIAELIETEAKDIENFIDSLDFDENVEFNKNGKTSYSFNHSIGALKGLPAGLNVFIDTAKASGSIEADKNTGKGNISVNGSLKAKADFDTSKAIGTEMTKTTLLKGAFIDVDFNGNSTISMRSDLSIYDDFEDFFYVEDDSTLIDVDAKANITAGMSFKTQKGLGGKVIVSVSSDTKDTYDMEEIDFILDTLDDLIDGYSSRREVKSLPLDLKMSIKFYDDKGNETFTLLDDQSLIEVYDDITNILEDLERIL